MKKLGSIVLPGIKEFSKARLGRKDNFRFDEVMCDAAF